MTKGKFIFILGGIRSGKSSFAQEMAIKTGREPVIYLATALPIDQEMDLRIKKHADSRPSHWTTVESPYEADRKLVSLCREPGIIILDCVSVFIANLLISGHDRGIHSEAIEKEIINRLSHMISEIKKSPAVVIAVANEVGMGLVSEYPLGRVYSDVAGRVNQLLAREVDEVYFLIAGIPMELKNFLDTL